MQPIELAPACASADSPAPMFWVREATNAHCPWMWLFTYVLAVPFKYAAVAQVTTVAVTLLPPVAARRRRSSLLLCPSADARYACVVRGINTAFGYILPGAAGRWVAEAWLSDRAAYHMLAAAAQLVFTLVLPLVTLARREWRQRLDFARRRRMATAVAGLQRWSQQWRHSAAELLLWAALAWAGGLVVAEWWIN